MRAQEKFVRGFYAFLIIALLIFINQTSIKNHLRRQVLDLSENFFETAHLFFFHLTGGIYKLGESVDVYKERDKLRFENAHLKQQLIASEEQRLENARLKALLDFKDNSEFTGKAARIIGRDILATSDMITINRGKADGVDVETVLMNQNGLIGHVITAGDKYATALLITDVRARVCAMVQETRESGIIQGTETALLKFKNLNINADVKIGDLVVTSGFGDIFPKGIAIGTVEMIGTESDNLYLYALVMPSVNFSKLEEVLCLNNE